MSFVSGPCLKQSRTALLNCGDTRLAEARDRVCQFCNSLQAPRPLLPFLQPPKTLAIDDEVLQHTFYQMTVLHPTVTPPPERERNYSLEATAMLNDGYRILKDPSAAPNTCCVKTAFRP